MENPGENPENIVSQLVINRDIKKASRECEYSYVELIKADNHNNYRAKVVFCKRKNNDPFGETLRAVFNGGPANSILYKYNYGNTHWDKNKPENIKVFLHQHSFELETFKSLIQTLPKNTEIAFIVHLNNTCENYKKVNFTENDLGLIAIIKNKKRNFLIKTEVIPRASLASDFKENW